MNLFRGIPLARCLIFLISGLILNQNYATPLFETTKEHYTRISLSEIVDPECREDLSNLPESAPLPNESPGSEDPDSEEESAGFDDFKIVAFNNDFRHSFYLIREEVCPFGFPAIVSDPGKTPTPPPER